MTVLYKEDEQFLRRVGANCRRAREAKGVSIDQLSRSSEKLSPSVIQRLETGSRPVTITSLHRYAAGLGVEMSALLGRYEGPVLIDCDDPRVAREAFKTLLPIYSLKAAAGYFGKGESVEAERWIEVTGHGRLDSRLFVARAAGQSMEPKIHDQDYLLFRAHPVGTRQNKIVLAQSRGIADSDTGGSFTVKKYTSRRTSHSVEITLSPLNKNYQPIVLDAANDDDVRVIAELVAVLG